MQRNNIALIVAATLALSACNKPGQPSGAGTGVTLGQGDEGARAKLSAYTEGYNKLLDTFGLPATAESYNKAAISTQSPADTISINTGWLEQGVTLLKAARAKSGGPADLDKVGDTLIGALDSAIKRLAGLDVYYESKAYRDDGLARGKQEDSAMKAELQAALTAMERFGAILDRERKAATAVELAALKAKGDMLGYNTKLALQQASALIDLFKGADDVANPAVFTRADGQLATLEKTLAAQRDELAKAKAAVKAGDRVDVNYGLVGDRLNAMVGDYRDLRSSHEGGDFNDMVEHYNDAIGDANDISE
ncbi:hypothetical protein ACVWZA_003444 [Sphingomonas sp. UYAg733]